MYEAEPKPVNCPEPGAPKWLIFVNKAPDDGPWLRMMVLNPLNGAMCPMINTPVDPDTHLGTPPGITPP
jgi:hypothetical protein